MEQHTCEICWDEIYKNELFLTGCKPVPHKFHIDCIKLNYQTFKNKECPMCRKSLHLNVSNIYPQCKYILKSGKNKGNCCSKKGKVEGYCQQHKDKINQQAALNTDNSGGDEPNPQISNVETVKCYALTKKGTNCKNKSKFIVQIDGEDKLLCGIHHKQHLNGSSLILGEINIPIVIS